MIKTARFHPKAREVLSAFPDDIKLELGKAIFDLQKGAKLTMPLSRPMSSVGVGVEELRVKDISGVYRIFYFARLSDAIWIIHAFQKKTQKTPHHEIDIAKKRLKEVLDGKT